MRRLDNGGRRGPQSRRSDDNRGMRRPQSGRSGGLRTRRPRDIRPNELRILTWATLK